MLIGDKEVRLLGQRDDAANFSLLVNLSAFRCRKLQFFS